MSRYINPPQAPTSPIRQPYYGRPSQLDQPKSHANVRPTLQPEDVSMWESMNLGKNAADTLTKVAGLQAADRELERVSHLDTPGQQGRTSSLGAPGDHKAAGRKALGAGALAKRPAESESTRHYTSGAGAGAGVAERHVPGTSGNLPAQRGLPSRSGYQPTVGSTRTPVLSSQAALERGTTQVPAYGIVQATHDKGDRMGRRTLPPAPPVSQLLPGPEETRNKARAAQQKSWKDVAPTYKQGSMF